jgi:hypothetical protein
MVRTLITHLGMQCVQVSADVSQAYERCASGHQQPPLTVVLEVLKALVSSFGDTYIVIDTLDESSSRSELLDILKTIYDWDFPSLDMLVTSRPERDIEIALTSLLSKECNVRLQSELFDRDIQTFIRESLYHWPKSHRQRDRVSTLRKITGHGSRPTHANQALI